MGNTSASEFARFAGELAESFSFNRSIGQIYGLLYVSAQPMSLDEIAKGLGMSKGNASINLRVLEGWGAVKPAYVDGSRKDHYEANRNLKELVLRRVQEGLSRRLDAAEGSLERLTAHMNGSADPFLTKRLQELRSYVQSGRKIVKYIPKALSLFAR